MKVFKEEFIENIVEEVIEKKKNLMVLGIGTDMVIFDSFGPLSAELLKDKNLKNIKVRGNFSDPFNGSNIKEKYKEITDDYIVLALDSRIVNYEKEKFVSYELNTSLSPGNFLKKDLPELGNHCIFADINIDSSEYLSFSKLYSGIRLGYIYNCAKDVVETIVEIDKVLSDINKSNKH